MQELKKWSDGFGFFLRNKIYMAFLSLTAVCSYGFLVTHQTVGIDDTPYAYYFAEGLNAIVGRWFLYLANKVFHVAEFSPFMTDLAGVLILMAAVVVWCCLLRSVCGERVPLWGYTFFGCIFISCPLISEVYTYYLHNGVSVGYLCTGLSLCFFQELKELSGFKRDRKQKAGGGKREAESGRREAKGGIRLLAAGLGSTAFLWIALGCYESFMIVWLLGVILVLLTEKYMGVPGRVFFSLAAAAGAAVVAIVLRSAMISLVIAVFGLGGMRDEAVQRSVTEMLGWIFEEGAAAEFAMVAKRFYVMYGVFAYAYYPVKIFVYASAFMLVFSVWRGAFLLVYAVHGMKAWRKESAAKGAFSRVAGGAVFLVLCTVLWNQCFDMNRWFYVDWMKYQAAVETVGQIAMELEKGFDTSKPVIFTGKYEVPREIIGDAYVSYGSETFYKLKRWTDPLDEHLLEKFYRSYGVWVAQTPELSVIEWGRNAFGDDSELARFFAMHGHELTPYTESENYHEIEVYSLGLPGFPREGSIVDRGDYIIVHF